MMKKSIGLGFLFGLIGVAVYVGLGYIIGDYAKIAAFLIVFLISFGIRLGGYQLPRKWVRFSAYLLLYLTYYSELAWRTYLIKNYYGIAKNFFVFLVVHMPGYYMEPSYMGTFFLDLLIFFATAFLAVNVLLPKQKKIPNTTTPVDE